MILYWIGFWLTFVFLVWLGIKDKREEPFVKIAVLILVPPAWFIWLPMFFIENTKGSR